MAINFRSTRESCSPSSNSGEVSEKLNSEVTHNFSKAKFHIPTTRYKRVYLVSLT